MTWKTGISPPPRRCVKTCTVKTPGACIKYQTKKNKRKLDILDTQQLNACPKHLICVLFLPPKKTKVVFKKRTKTFAFVSVLFHTEFCV